MYQYLILILAICGCEPRNCDDPDRPNYPEIGGCLQGAARGTGGGPCHTGTFGAAYYCDDGFACVSGTCYDCGDAGELCCGSQSPSGTCETGQGPCAMDSSEYYKCQADGSEPPEGCQSGDPANFFVWVLSTLCEAELVEFCAVDDADAQDWVDANLPGVEHGPIVTDPVSGQPTDWTVCPTGDLCFIGSSDGSLAMTLKAYTHAQLEACEANLSQNCTWPDGLSDGTCPAQP